MVAMAMRYSFQYEKEDVKLNYGFSGDFLTIFGN
jgi:hypothetical protein